jgi:hypothetical protein
MTSPTPISPNGGRAFYFVLVALVREKLIELFQPCGYFALEMLRLKMVKGGAEGDTG